MSMMSALGPLFGSIQRQPQQMMPPQATPQPQPTQNLGLGGASHYFNAPGLSFGSSYRTPQQMALQSAGLGGIGGAYRTPMQQQVAAQAQPPRQFNPAMANMGAQLLGSGQPMTLGQMLPFAMQAFRKQGPTA